MYSHNIFFNVHIQNTLVNGREKKFFALCILNHINIISTCFHYILQNSHRSPILCHNLHSDQICNIILIFFQILCFLSGDPQLFAFIFLYIINIINIFKFQDHKILEKLYILDVKLFLLPACIQKNIFKIRKAFCIRCRIYLYFSSHTMCGSDHTYF